MLEPTITMKAVDKLPIYNDLPSVVESDVSSISSFSDIPAFIRTTPRRNPLKWEFYGLTLWLEFEEFDNDLTKANYYLASKYGTEVIPTVHCTAIYGMEHLSEQEAGERLARVSSVLPEGKWPMMERPVAVKQDLAQEGRPGQVCNVSWAELTLKTNEEHEKAMDALCKLFEVDRKGPWTPHMSLAYDNPEDSVLQLSDVIAYLMQNPTLLQEERRVKAVSLWSTKGKLSDWKCLDRINLFQRNG